MHGSADPLRLAAFAAALVLAASSSAVFAAADAHEHEHAHGTAEAKLVLDQGRKWQTDAVARKGMLAIRSALAVEFRAVRGGTLTDAQYQALATRVNATVADMVKNCKLEPKADAQFHVVLAAIMAGAEVMEGKHPGESRRGGAEQVAHALNDYGRHFAHPGWKRL